MTKLDQWLYNLQINTGAIKLGLDNIIKAGAVLNLAKPAPYVVTVAGTNGKGSVVRLLEAFFTDQGFNTGCYTSPHLIDFNERICVNKQPLSDEKIVEVFNYVQSCLDSNKLNLTFFEFITVSAWYYFQSINLDILILEVGLGGRLDAVNAIPKDLAIITSVDFDHEKFLGDTLEKIGAEKAGIITKNGQVIFGDVMMPDSVKLIAESQSANAYQFSKEYDLNLVENKDFQGYFTDNERALELNLTNNLGLKLNNIATALKAVSIIDKDFKACFKTDKLQQTLKDFKLVGRCSWFDQDKTVLLDVAHNVQSVKNLASFLSNHIDGTKKRIIAICGMLNDKNSTECLKVLSPIIEQWNFVTILGERGHTASELFSILKQVNKNQTATLFDDFDTCNNMIIELMQHNADKSTIIVVFGSFHVVGPIYKYITKQVH